MLATPITDHRSHRKQARNSSPQSRLPTMNPFYNTPLLTPSPNRSRSMFPPHSDPQFGGQNDIDGLQSPFRTPAIPNMSWLAPSDNDGLVFIGAGEPLLTPSRQQSSQSPQATHASTAQTSRVGAGIKRKTTPHSTPLRQHTLTPLVVASSQQRGAVAFDRLAPLPPPKFGSRTPKTRTETDASLRSQTTSLTHLDLNKSPDDLGLDDDDSGSEYTKPRKGALFSEHKEAKAKSSHRLFKDVHTAEVAEAISPGGHVTKRRARSRPLSDELLQTVRSSPSPAERSRNNVTFPGKKTHHRRKSSGSSSSSGATSPVPRTRVYGLNGPTPSRPSHLQQRGPMARVDSATLFFGGPSLQAPAVRSRTNTTLSNSSIPNEQFLAASRPKVSTRHSYAGAGGVNSWQSLQPRSMLPSPQSSPPTTSTHGDKDTAHEETDDEDEIFNGIRRNSSFVLSIDTPSPHPEKVAITSKFKQARDSGIGLSDDDTSMDSCASAEQLMPQASTSVSSIFSEADDDGLVTPGFGPTAASGWPQVYGSDDEPGSLDVDAFILRTLTTAAKAPSEVKKAPNTPVKKVKTSYLSGDRPWQSAVAHRVGRGIDWEVKPAVKAPRKSMPLGFPPTSVKQGKSAFDPRTDSEDEQDSPSSRKEKYAGLGLGRPTFGTPRDVIPAIPRPKWLARRSSSGAFSSGSDSMSLIGTPTRLQGGSRASRVSPSKRMSRFSPARSASGSSTSSILSSPTTTRQHPSPAKQRAAGRKNFAPRPSLPSPREQIGRFDRDFIVVDEIGSGEFGKVIKAQAKVGGEMYAIKKSKPFEGVKHRHRLREEAEILRHLGRMNAGQLHPNVLAFVDSWEEDEVLYIQTELCEMGSLAHFLWEYGRKFPRLDEARVWKIIADLSNGLMFIHHSGVIHLDVKPANIFITSEGRFKIGDFGLASLWPRPVQSAAVPVPPSAFEREGDKLYLAPEVLQGNYSKAADVFSFGMTMLETAANIVVPDQGESWHRLRREDFSQVDLDDSPELFKLIQQMMRTDPATRIDMQAIYAHPVVTRARQKMDMIRLTAKREGTAMYNASPLAGVADGFLEDILGQTRDMSDGGAMDLSL